ncbi:DUF5666 domain-containing protein [Pseudomonas sp. LFM046]|uniref:DUF5666 domain-containing protein n=1 Tax=Pseudomonas sp. LFM046 TaxID=1608357 RepID=UPI0005CF97FC|nr:DUF5666 domain-containing protein [Pseudomonas sp. LFM046]
MNTASRLLRLLAFVCGPLLLAPTALSAAPVCLEPGGMGGTGAVATGGIGGTGAPAQEEGGIGGTGIVGTITGFGSICVNGVEVHFDNNAPLSENGVPASTNQLAIGQVVAVEATKSPRGLEARSIAILHAYEGPITGVAEGTAPMRVMGQPVRLAAGARVTEGLRVGDAVRVSGLRNAIGDVVATRIERAPKLTQVSAIGAVERGGDLQGLALSKSLSPSTEVLVRGTWDGKRLSVLQTRADPSIPFAGRVRNALVEGLVRAQKGDRIEIGGFTAHLDRETAFAGGKAAELAVDQRIRVSGVFDGGRTIRAHRIEFVRERAESTAHQGSGHDGSGSDDSDQDGSGSNSGSGNSGPDDDSHHGGSGSSGSGSGETRERVEQSTVSPDGTLERRVRTETRQSGDRVEVRERIEVFENGQRIERIERIERSDKPDRVERVERPDSSGRPERPERVEREDHSGPN